MASHLLTAGYPLHLFNRTKLKAQPLLDRGATWHSCAAEVAATSDVIFTMLGFPKDVEETYFGFHGLLQNARPGSLLVDMTTSSPHLAQRIADAAAARGLACLDAPVSGGDIGAREARLVIMVGGEPSPFERALPLFQKMGKQITLLGKAGAGQHAKLANQIAVAVGMVAWCEALAYARKAGLNPSVVQQCLSGGAAGSWGLSNLAPRALQGNFEPGFYVKHILKDMRIALESAEELQLSVPGLSLAKALYEDVAAHGWENQGTQALYRLYSLLQGIEAPRPPRPPTAPTKTQSPQSAASGDEPLPRAGSSEKGS